MKKIISLVVAAVVAANAVEFEFHGSWGVGLGGYSLDSGNGNVNDAVASFYADTEFVKLTDKLFYGVGLEATAYNNPQDKTYSSNSLTTYAFSPLALRYFAGESASLYAIGSYVIGDMGGWDFDGWGAKVGVDYMVGDHFAIGLAYGYEDLEPDKGSGELKTHRGLLTLGYRW